MSKDRESPIGVTNWPKPTAFIPMAIRDKPYTAAMVGFGSGMGPTIYYPTFTSKTRLCRNRRRNDELSKRFYALQ